MPKETKQPATPPQPAPKPTPAAPRPGPAPSAPPRRRIDEERGQRFPAPAPPLKKKD